MKSSKSLKSQISESFEKNFIHNGDTVKITGLCITSNDVRPFLRNKKSDKKGSKK